MVYDPIHGCIRGYVYNDIYNPNEVKQEKPSNDEAWEKIVETVNQPSVIKRGQLRFLIGLQRSGKSTWATNWMRLQPRCDTDGIIFPRAVVCADNIRLAVTGQRFNRRAEPTVFMIKDYMVEALLQRGHDSLVDGTHTTEISIRRNLEIDIDASWTLINTPVEICKERAITTNQPDLIPVLDRTNTQLQRLLDKGIDKVIENIKDDISYRRGKQNEMGYRRI